MTSDRAAAFAEIAMMEEKRGVTSTRHILAALIEKADEAPKPSWWEQVKGYVVQKQMERTIQ